MIAAAIRRRQGELIPRGQKAPLDLGLSLHAFGEIRELVRHDLGSRPIQAQPATLRVLLAHEANRL
jgi:hypothetical protein